MPLFISAQTWHDLVAVDTYEYENKIQQNDDVIRISGWTLGLGNAKIESQYSQEKEDTKLKRNVHTSKVENAEKIINHEF